jgi:DNA-binding NarL/FixJ family response regulator
MDERSYHAPAPDPGGSESHPSDDSTDVVATAHRLMQADEPRAVKPFSGAVACPPSEADGAAPRALPKPFPHRRWSVVGAFVEGGVEYLVVRKKPALLSQRETQVVNLLRSGHHMKLIAYELGISHSTVRVLAARAHAKLRAHSMIGA